MLRLYAEARAHPEMFGEIREQAISRFVLDERQRVAEAIRAGVLPPGASPVRILDAVEGAIFMHLLVTPPQLLPRVRAGLDDYVQHMVDDQLRAAGYDAAADLRRAALLRERRGPGTALRPGPTGISVGPGLRVGAAVVTAGGAQPSRKETPNPPRG